LTAPDLSSLLSQAVKNLNEDQIDAADVLLSEIEAAFGGVPQALMLTGVVRLKQGRCDEAEALLAGVLRQYPSQPTALFYFGKVQFEKGDRPAAIKTYRKAIAARPDYADAELALASCLRTMGILQEAKEIYGRILARTPNLPPAMAGLGGVLSDRQEFTEAERILTEGEKIPAEKDVASEIENNLGTVKMLQRRFAEALPHFERALFLKPALVEAQRNRATILEHLQQPKRAAQAYRNVLAQEPTDLKTHLLLNELFHRDGRDSEILKSYDEAGRRRPASPVLPSAKADQLLLLDRPAEAADCYRRALRLDPNHLPAQIGLGRTLGLLGEHSGAITAFEAAMRSHPRNPDLQTAFAACLLRQAEAARAQQLAENAVRAAPFNQAALAVLGLCYRARGDAREGLLNDYDRFVQIFDLEPPEGYEDISAFHDELRVHLASLHADATQFFSQTLRGGTRSSEGIFEFRQSLRDKLKGRIIDALARYIGRMPENTAHPFLGRRESGAFRFSGSWSSHMRGGGYHVNHIHNGWISSVYYVDVPDIVADPAGKQGWLKFGEPSADLGFQDSIQRMVQPKPGRLVLFPSYLWHGTVPFHSDDVRTTIAFDAVPHEAS
jgi:tetratricopeptide (TPR) repeat protein